jgi:hypothetical protein
MIALIHMATEIRRATDLDGSHCTPMPHRQSMGAAIGWTIGAKDIGHFKTALHRKPPP